MSCLELASGLGSGVDVVPSGKKVWSVVLVGDGGGITRGLGNVCVIVVFRVVWFFIEWLPLCGNID